MTDEVTSGPGGSEPEACGAGPKEPQPHPTRADAEMAMDYRALRTLIGAIAVLLVVVVYVGNWAIFTHHVQACLWPPSQRIPVSLSGFYYTHMRGLFVGAMCAMGVFFVAYRGHDRWDNWFTNIAGIAAICVALFPTKPPFWSNRPNSPNPNQFFTRANPCGPTTLITYHESSIQWLFNLIHEISLAVLFLMVFLMVLVQFTRADRADPEAKFGAWRKSVFSGGIGAWFKRLFADDQGKSKKKTRNKVYVWCAGGVAISGTLAIVTAIWTSIGKTEPWLLFAEIGAFLSFGIAWYVKGAAAARNHPQLLVKALSWPARRLADPGEPVGGSGAAPDPAPAAQAAAPADKLP